MIAAKYGWIFSGGRKAYGKLLLSFLYFFIKKQVIAMWHIYLAPKPYIRTFLCANVFFSFIFLIPEFFLQSMLRHCCLQAYKIFYDIFTRLGYHSIFSECMECGICGWMFLLRHYLCKYKLFTFPPWKLWSLPIRYVVFLLAHLQFSTL